MASHPHSHPNQAARPRRVGAAIVAASLLLLAGCSGGTDTAIGSADTSAAAGDSTTVTTAVTTRSSSTTRPTNRPTTVTTRPSSTTGSTVTTVEGCATGPTTVPAGAVTTKIVDVDGDGRPDTAWLATGADGSVEVGIVTAAGGGATHSWTSASPVRRSLLVAVVNEASPPILLADDGRTVQLWDFVDCGIATVQNQQGQPYTFSLGFTDVGTGVGCATINGRQELVGLNAVPNADGTTVDWTSTMVTVSGTGARNGTVTGGTYTSPGDDAQIDRLHQVTCGSLTAADSLTLPQ